MDDFLEIVSELPIAFSSLSVIGNALRLNFKRL
jgi:hypothetical protein